MAVPIARDALLVSTSATPSYASSVLLLDAAQPAPQTPLLQLRLQQQPHSVGPERLDYLPTVAPALSDGAVHAGMVVSAAMNKPAVALHSFQSPQQLAQLFLPGPITCLATNRRHGVLATGQPDGSISVWDLRSGELLANAFDAHYQPVSLLRWTEDGLALLSGGEDGRVCVWTLASIVDPASLSTGPMGPSSTDQPIPWAILTDHTLKITSLVHQGTFPGQVWSASEDGTVKRWNLPTRRVVSTFAFPVPVSHVQVDDLGRYFVACTRASSGPGSDAERAAAMASSTAEDGIPGSNTVYRIDLFRKPLTSSADAGKSGSRRKRRAADHHPAKAIEPVGALGSHGICRVHPTDHQSETATHPQLQLSEPISALTVTPGGPQIVLGTTGGKLHFLDLASMRVIRTVSLVESLTSSGPVATAQAKLPTVTSILSLRTPADLHSSTLPTGAEDGTPSSLISPVQVSAVRALRASGRVRSGTALPVVPNRLERVTRAFAHAHTLTQPATDRPYRLPSGVDVLGMADQLAPNFFASTPQEPAVQDARPELEQDVVLLDSDDSAAVDEQLPGPQGAPFPPPSELQLQNAQLHSGLAHAKDLNDQLWERIQRLEARVAQRS